MNSRARYWIFGIVSLALFMAMLDNLVVITALPTIRKALGASVSDLEWTVNGYTLAFATLMMTGAALGDRFGRKRMFLLGVGLFTAGSALSALSGSSTSLIVARAIQGTGAAFITPLTLTILSRAFPAEQRAAAIGLWAGVSGLGLAIGPLVGGAVINGLPWNAIFWINVPVGVLVLVLGFLRLDESRGEPRPLDLPGLGLAAAGLFGITFGLVRGNALGWTSGTILVALIAGALLLAGFVARERMTRAPMLELGLFGSRGFSAANVAGFLMSAGMFGSIFFLTLYVQEVLHATPLEAGIKTMPWTGTIMIVAPFAGFIAGRIGPRLVVVAGLLAQAGALFWIAEVASATTPYPQLLPAFILGGVGMGLTFAPLSATVMASVSGYEQGQASGAYNAIRELGGVFGVAVFGAVFQHIAMTPLDFIDAFRTTLFAASGVVGIGVLAATLLPSTAVSETPEVASSEAAA